MTTDNSTVKEMNELFAKKGVIETLKIIFSEHTGLQQVIEILLLVPKGFDVYKEEELRSRGLPLLQIRENQAIDALVFHRMFYGVKDK